MTSPDDDGIPRDRDAERALIGHALAPRPIDLSTAVHFERVRERAFRQLYGKDDFIAAVLARLDVHGPTAAPRASAELLAELIDEALDLAGWSCLALTAAPEEDRDELLRRLAPVVALAEQAHAALRRAQHAGGHT